MNRLVAPLMIFIPLCLALGFALFKPESQLPARMSHTLPAISLHPLEAPQTSAPFVLDPKRITILNFFASWCVPCLAEHGEWSKLAVRKDVSLQGVAWNDTPENVRQWLAKHGNPYDAMWIDHDGDAALTLGLRGVPETYVITPDGNVTLHIRGAITPDVRAQMEQLIRNLKREVEHGARAQ